MKGGMGCDERRVFSATDESLNSTPETNNMLYVNSLNLNGRKKNREHFLHRRKSCWVVLLHRVHTVGSQPRVDTHIPIPSHPSIAPPGEKSQDHVDWCQVYGCLLIQTLETVSFFRTFLSLPCQMSLALLWLLKLLLQPPQLHPGR